MIRRSVKEAVDLCLYVSTWDANAESGGRPQIDSYRKMRWKERQQAAMVASLPQNAEQSTPQTEVSETTTCDPQQHQQPQFDGPNVEESEQDVGYDSSEFRLDQYLNQFVASTVSICDVRKLPIASSSSHRSHKAISIPSRREGHSMTLCSTEMFNLLLVFGGRVLRDLTNLLPVAVSAIDPLKLERVRYAFSNAVYMYDLARCEWTLRECQGRAPRERSDHSAVFVAPHFLIVFGGRGRSGQVFDDCFALSLREWEWVEIETRSRPSPRYWHGCCVEGATMYVFGGKSESMVYSDLQQLRLSRVITALMAREDARDQDISGRVIPSDSVVRLPESWVLPHTVGKPPSARFGARMVPMNDDQISIVGGWRAVRKSKGSYSTAVFVLDTSSMVWTKPRPASQICTHMTPPERFGFECFYAFGTLVVFGGFVFTTDGATESYAVRADDREVVYKLDARRMIWRRELLEAEEVSFICTDSPTFTSGSLQRQGADRVGHVCVVRAEEEHIHMASFNLKQSAQSKE